MSRVRGSHSLSFRKSKFRGYMKWKISQLPSVVTVDSEALAPAKAPVSSILDQPLLVVPSQEMKEPPFGGFFYSRSFGATDFFWAAITCSTDSGIVMPGKATLPHSLVLMPTFLLLSFALRWLRR